MPSKLPGILFIDKPVGITSSLVDKICKRTFGLFKVGHLGTLDPFASGLLPIVFNGATKLIPYIKWTDQKTYLFEIEFGTQTNTGDITGRVTATTSIVPTKQQIETMLPKFIGKIQQKPHIYSAVKVAGQPAYKLARNGITPDIKAKAINIYDLKLISGNGTLYKFEATVSSGTYMRSLAEDVASALGSLGYTKSLRRTKIGSYNNGVSLDFIRNCRKNISEVVNCSAWLSVDDILDDIPVVHVSDSEAVDLRLGKKVRCITHAGTCLVKASNGLVNLSECISNYLQPKKLIVDIGD